MLPPDQFRFIASHLVGLTLAGPYRLVPEAFRNEFNYIPGILMLYYCFGAQANSFMLFSAVSYLACKFTPLKHVQRITMTLSLSFLSYAHLSRQIIDYGGYVIDISGPFMIAVQKMSSLGFCLHDGYKLATTSTITNKKKQTSRPSSPKDPVHHDGQRTSRSRHNMGSASGGDDNNNQDSLDDFKRAASSVNSLTPIKTPTKPRGKSPKVPIIKENLTLEQRHYAIEEPVNFREFMGYFFHFPSVMCGPIMYYKDYSDFVRSSAKDSIPGGAIKASFKKVIISFTSATLLLLLAPKFHADFLRSADFLVHTPLIMRFFYITIFTMLSRLKYYVAWHLGEAVSNATGFGFNGYSDDGEPKWDLVSNMDLWKFETSSNLRDAILAWNKTTQNWLRRTAYERAPKLNMLATYILSAVWHGFYPGYYMTFLSGALFTQAARVGRRKVRPIFLQGYYMPRLYDVITFTLTRLTIAYLAFPFVILDFHNSLAIYKSLYFSLHILGIAGIFIGLLPI